MIFVRNECTERLGRAGSLHASRDLGHGRREELQKRRKKCCCEPLGGAEEAGRELIWMRWMRGEADSDGRELRGMLGGDGCGWITACIILAVRVWEAGSWNELGSLVIAWTGWT